MTSPQKDLITGYIREIELRMINQIIPYSINTIIFQYYFAQLLLCYITKELTKPWYIADVETNGQKIWQSQATSLGKVTKEINGGFTKPCIGYNIKLPSHFTKNIDDDIANKSYHAIFHCGGYLHGRSKSCSAILFDSKDPQTLSTNHNPGML